MTDELTTPDTTHEGSSRRDFLRRSAIVGGTLVWAAPTVQSMAPAAYAADSTKSPKDFSYLVLCLRCPDGQCCVKFDLDDNGNSAGFEAGGSFSVPGCEDKFSMEPFGSPGCASEGEFTVTPIEGAQRVQVTYTGPCSIIDSLAFGKCGNPNNPASGGACVNGTLINANTIEFSFCG